MHKESGTLRSKKSINTNRFATDLSDDTDVLNVFSLADFADFFEYAFLVI
ncbi:hypothetical protein J2Y40_004686 [Chryseobacterium sp. 2987]|nr:hypothetical protein [Chryseobacterium sp. 2987]